MAKSPDGGAEEDVLVGDVERASQTSLPTPD